MTEYTIILRKELEIETVTFRSHFTDPKTLHALAIGRLQERFRETLDRRSAEMAAGFWANECEFIILEGKVVYRG